MCCCCSNKTSRPSDEIKKLKFYPKNPEDQDVNQINQFKDDRSHGFSDCCEYLVLLQAFQSKRLKNTIFKCINCSTFALFLQIAF